MYFLKIHKRMPVIKESIASVPKSSTVEMVSNLPPQIPAIRFPQKLVKNQHPIIKDKNFLGASLDTRDKPIGDRHSSAMVIIKYATTSHNGETCPLLDIYPAHVIIKNADDIMNKAMLNLLTEDGSIDLALNDSHNAEITGARVIIKSGFRD